MKDKQYIGFKDAKLLRRMERIVELSKGDISKSDILRAALIDKLDQIERDGELKVIRKFPAIAPPKTDADGI